MELVICEKDTMTKRRTGFFPLVVGAVMGAAAVFLSDEKNRKLAKESFDEAKQDPKAFAKKTADKVNRASKKVFDKTKSAAKHTEQQAKRKAKKIKEILAEK